MLRRRATQWETIADGDAGINSTPCRASILLTFWGMWLLFYGASLQQQQGHKLHPPKMTLKLILSPLQLHALNSWRQGFVLVRYAWWSAITGNNQITVVPPHPPPPTPSPWISTSSFFFLTGRHNLIENVSFTWMEYNFHLTQQWITQPGLISAVVKWIYNVHRHKWKARLLAVIE